MPLDHYVSQVHLRKFYSPALGNRLYAIRKSDLKAFTPNSQSVCRIEDASTNAYLRKNREIEEFLKTVEPKYNSTLEKVIAGKIDAECVHTLAGFIAYVSTCSPAGMRIQSGPLRTQVEEVAAILDNKGMLPPSPPTLGGATLSELIRSGEIKIVVDPKYPQAIGIRSILTLTAILGNFDWEFLHNEFSDNPFFTSDFPVAAEQTNDERILNKVVPLAPNLALRIRPDVSTDRRSANLSFANFRVRSRRISHDELLQINRLLVRCAEDTIFFRDDRPWVKPFVAKHRHYRIEPHTQKIIASSGTSLISTLKVSKP